MNQKNNINIQAKLQWACRRGMLELDVLLGNFLNEAYPGLSIQEKEQFEELLGCSDPELFAWLLGREQPVNQTFVHMTDLIRKHARSRLSS